MLLILTAMPPDLLGIIQCGFDMGYIPIPQRQRRGLFIAIAVYA